MDTFLSRYREMIEQDDAYMASHGIYITELKVGAAEVECVVTPALTSFHGLAHGGLIYTLADCAFGVAGNTHNERSLAVSVNVTYLAPGRVGDTLRAHAEEIYRHGRRSVYRLTVTQKQGEVLAIGTGVATSLPEQVVVKDSDA